MQMKNALNSPTKVDESKLKSGVYRPRLHETRTNVQSRRLAADHLERQRSAERTAVAQFALP
jgi:hypothetical protein